MSKNHRLSKLAALVLTVAALTGGVVYFALAQQDDAITIDRNITSNDLVRQMTIGWNLGNTLDAYFSGNPGVPIHWANNLNNTPAIEAAWLGGVANRTTQSLIDAIYNAGFNTIRIPVSWHKAISGTIHYAQPGDPGHRTGVNQVYNRRITFDDGYPIDPRWLAHVQSIVDMAYSRGMFVILNTHHDEYIFRLGNADDEAGLAYRARGNAAVEYVWTQIATHFQNYGERLVFATLNEPRHRNAWPAGGWDWTGSDFARESVNIFNQTAVNTIRETGGNNSYRHIMFPTYAAQGHNGQLNAFRLPTDPARPGDNSKLILSVHIYSPHNWAHDGWISPPWTPGPTIPINRDEPSFTDDHKNQISTDLTRVANRAAALGVPVIMGEWGTLYRHNLQDRIDHAYEFVRTATALESRTPNPVVMRTVVWDDHGTSATGLGFRLVNRQAPHISENARQIILAMILGRWGGIPCAVCRVYPSTCPTVYATPHSHAPVVALPGHRAEFEVSVTNAPPGRHYFAHPSPPGTPGINIAWQQRNLPIDNLPDWVQVSGYIDVAQNGSGTGTMVLTVVEPSP